MLHGRAQREVKSVGRNSLADDLAAILNRRDLDEVTLVAHAAGGGEIIRYLTSRRRACGADRAFPTLTNLTISGGFDLGGPTNYPQGRTDYIYQVIDNYTWTLPNTRTGEHSVKAGAQVKIFEADSFFDSNYRGQYTFPSLNAATPSESNSAARCGHVLPQ